MKKNKDGYKVIPERKPWGVDNFKGFKCGKCGMKFDAGKLYGFHCIKENCPMQYNIT